MPVENLREKLDELRMMGLVTPREARELLDAFDALENPAVAEEAREHALMRLRASPLGVWLDEVVME